MRKIILSIFVLCLLFASCACMKQSKKNTTSMEGTWELSYISGPRIAFDGLYPNKKPIITFDLKENRVSGNNSCNSYSSKLAVNGNKVSFKASMVTTKMMCMDAKGETVYMTTLQKIDSYTISEDGKTLNFIMGNVPMMRFEKK